MTPSVNKRITLHAKEWTTQINVARPHIDRLSSGERTAFEYIINIFNNPSPDFKLLFSYRETLHTTAMEIHDRFGAALRCVAAKTVLIKRDFESFRNAVYGLSDITTANSEEPEIGTPETNGADIALRMMQRIEYENGDWYEGYLDSDGKWNGEGKYYDSYRCGTLYGTFVHGQFPAYGKFIDSFDGVYEGGIRKVKNGTAFALFGKGRYTTYNNEVFESDGILVRHYAKSVFGTDHIELRFDHNATVDITFSDGCKFHGKAFQLQNAAGKITYPDGTIDNCDIIFHYHAADENTYKIERISPVIQQIRNITAWTIGIAAPVLTCILTPGLSYGWLFFIAMFLISLSTLKIYSGTGKSAIISVPVASMAMMIITSIYLSLSISWWYLFGIIPAALFGFGALMLNYKFHNLSGDDFYFGD